MGHDYRRSNRDPGASTSVTGSVGTPGKRTLTEALSANVAPVQRKTTGATTDDHVHEAAQRGVAGGGSALPHLDTIQRAFGRHDVSKIQAHTGDAAARASTEIGAEAYATGNHVAFVGVPDLRTTAHEAAHVVQQRAGVHLKGGVGETGDVYERNADEVADRVVRGENAADLLPGGGSSPGSAVQRTDAGGALQRKGGNGRNTVDYVGQGQITVPAQESQPHATWTFPVIVNGQAGVARVYVLSGVPYDDIVAYLISELESGAIKLEGIAQTDGTGGDSRVADGTDHQGDDEEDDDDGALADGGGVGGSGDDWGDSA